jgi:hypothetical protein
MKMSQLTKSPALWAVLVLFLFPCIAACKSTPAAGTGAASPGGAIPFQLHVKETSVPLLPAQGASSPRISFSLTLLELPRQDALERLVEKVFYDGVDPQNYGNRLINRYRDTYLEMVQTQKEHPDMPMESLNWEYSEVMEISFPASSLAQISQSREYYLGGAHGMREKKYALIDTVQARQLKLEDLIKRGSMAELHLLVEAELRTLSGIDKGTPLSQGGFFEDTPDIPENFFIDPKGFGFHWDPYEIAPYAAGPIDIVLAPKQVKNLLKIDIFP